MFRLLALLLVLAGPASAQNLLMHSGKAVQFTAAAGGYTGPGDVVATANAWWGLRAYSTADLGNRLINLCNPADSTCIDVSSDVVTGALTAPTNVGGTDCTAVTTCTIKTWYSRAGNNCVTSSNCDVTQATAASRPTLTWSCVNSKPCAVFAGAQFLVASNNAVSLPQPFTTSAVSIRTANFTTAQEQMRMQANNTFAYRQATNTIQMFAGTAAQIVANITDNNWHAFQALYNGASSQLMCGGSAGTNCSNGGTDNAISPGANATDANAYSVGGAAGGTNPLSGNIAEIGIWGSGFDGTQRTNMNANQITYWGPF